MRELTVARENESQRRNAMYEKFPFVSCSFASLQFFRSISYRASVH